MTLMLLLAGINVIAFALMGWDKRLAETNARSRIPERTLLLLALCGGALGTLIGQQLFRHKTKKQPFRLILWGAALLNILAGVLFFWIVIDRGLAF